MASVYDKPADKPMECALYPSLKNKVVIVTGASSGIGAATAVSFAKNGAKLSLHGRNVERLQQVATLCVEAGANKDEVLCINGDITKEEEIEKLVNKTVEIHGGIDILVNNAGFTTQNNIQDSSVEGLDFMYKLNSRSVYHLCRLAIPHLKKSKGSIVTVSSLVAIKAAPFMVDYCMSKAMVEMLTKSLALELASSGVRANSVNPALIRSNIFSREGGFLGEPETQTQKEKNEKELYDKFAPLHPIGRVGWPEEVAQSILFLASDSASFITGHSLLLDGGCYLTSSITCPPQ